jgi:hypothetical protein
MDYDEIQIGKVTKYNDLTQIGEIVSTMGPFMFIRSDVVYDDDEELQLNDIVQFRGEQVQNTNRAFFVKKFNRQKELDTTSHIKTYKLSDEGNDN